MVLQRGNAAGFGLTATALYNLLEQPGRTRTILGHGHRRLAGTPSTVPPVLGTGGAP